MIFWILPDPFRIPTREQEDNLLNQLFFYLLNQLVELSPRWRWQHERIALKHPRAVFFCHSTEAVFILLSFAILCNFSRFALVLLFSMVVFYAVFVMLIPLKFYVFKPNLVQPNDSPSLIVQRLLLVHVWASILYNHQITATKRPQAPGWLLKVCRNTIGKVAGSPHEEQPRRNFKEIAWDGDNNNYLRQPTNSRARNGPSQTEDASEPSTASTINSNNTWTAWMWPSTTIYNPAAAEQCVALLHAQLSQGCQAHCNKMSWVCKTWNHNSPHEHVTRASPQNPPRRGSCETDLLYSGLARHNSGRQPVDTSG